MTKLSKFKIEIRNKRWWA